MNPQELSYELRRVHTPDLQRRRWIIGLSMIGATMGQLVTLYQTGIIKRLPPVPLPFFDANRVDASNYAYKRLRTPDGVMMVTTYALTAWLAAAGGKDRAQQQPLLPLAMGLKTIYDAMTNLKLAREEWDENQAFCEYCQLATLCTFASVVLALPEMLHASRRLLGRDAALLEPFEAYSYEQNRSLSSSQL